MKNPFVKNVCTMLRRRGLSGKYEHTGIYCIKLNDQIVYIGKSRNMLERIASHYVGIRQGSERKYRILAEAQRKGYSVDFGVLYYAKSQRYQNIVEEIGQKEGEFIREYRPVLNTQIPKETDWHKWEVNEIKVQEVLKLLLEE